MAVLAGAHQRRGALVVLHVDVGPLSQQGPNHVHPAVTDRQHEPRLAGLGSILKTDDTLMTVMMSLVISLPSRCLIKWKMDDSDKDSYIRGITVEQDRIFKCVHVQWNVVL